MDYEEQYRRIWHTLDSIAESNKKFDARMKRISKDFGGFQNNMSDFLEIEFCEAVREHGRIGDSVVHEVYHSQKNKNAEYDVVAVNDGAVFVGEIKHKFLPADVREFVDTRLPRFAEAFPEHAKGRQIFGMIGGGQIVEDAEKLAKERGLILLRLQSRGLQAENTKSAQPIKH